MALDYKTRQAMAESQPANTTSYCPECGRPWADPVPERARRATTFPWRAALLGVLGLFLAITFGQRTAVLVEAESSVCAVTLETPSGPGCFAHSAEGEIRSDLLGTAGGVALVLVGIGALIRPRLRARSSSGPSFLIDVWAVGETLWVVVSLQVLALYADLVIVRLSQGWPSAWWEGLDLITDQVSTLFYFITGF
jgi:hypothetical protein